MAGPATGRPPTFHLDEDGRHVWWFHDCNYGPEADPALRHHRAEVMLPLGPDRWTLVSAQPLTVSPSILCAMPGCGTLGFITDGVWRPA